MNGMTLMAIDRHSSVPTGGGGGGKGGRLPPLTSNKKKGSYSPWIKEGKVRRFLFLPPRSEWRY